MCLHDRGMGGSIVYTSLTLHIFFVGGEGAVGVEHMLEAHGTKYSKDHEPGKCWIHWNYFLWLETLFHGHVSVTRELLQQMP